MLTPAIVIVGCLLRSLPTDIEFDNTTGISFTCDLSDNIAAPWPSSSSVQSLSLCAPGKQRQKLIFGSQKYCTAPYDFSPLSLNINVSLSHIGISLMFSEMSLPALPVSPKSGSSVGTSRTGIGVLLPLVFLTTSISIWGPPHLVSQELLTHVVFFPSVQALV